MTKRKNLLNEDAKLKKEFTQFGKQRSREAQYAVQDEQKHGQGQHLLGGRKVVDDLFEDQRHADVGNLGTDQATERGGDAQAVTPDIGQQRLQSQPDVSLWQGLSGGWFG